MPTFFTNKVLYKRKTMSDKSSKVKIPLIKMPIKKKVSSFVGGNSMVPKKVIPNKDAYKRQ